MLGKFIGVILEHFFYASCVNRVEVVYLMEVEVCVPRAAQIAGAGRVG